MRKRRRHAKQASMWVAIQDLPCSAAHPFYARLNQILEQHGFDGYVEGLCERFYADAVGRGCHPGVFPVAADGYLAHKAEHAVDLEPGAIVGITRRTPTRATRRPAPRP